MTWLDRLLGRPRIVDDWAELAAGLVELEGAVEPLQSIVDPLTDDLAVAIDYVAWPPSVTVGYAVTEDRGFQVRASQAVPFLLRRDAHQLLVRPAAGEDVVKKHLQMLERYGVNVRVETTLICAGQTLRVVGRVAHVSPQGSPHRADPYAAIIDAERFWIP